MDGAAATLFGTKSASHNAHLKVNGRNGLGGDLTLKEDEEVF